MLDSFLFVLQSRAAARTVVASGAQRIFALCGNDSIFLSNALLLARKTSLPCDIYLVDDIETSHQLVGKPVHGKILAWVERRLLPKANRVFTISEGYAEHLRTKYGIEASLLPVPVRYSKSAYTPSQLSDRRVVGFSGSINPLYLKPLRQLCTLLDKLNLGRDEVPWSLVVYTRAGKEAIMERLGYPKCLEVAHPSSNEELVRMLSRSTVNFLPYSDEKSPGVEIMVKTAFSCKISEYFASGRPILAYGPSDSSTVSYFKKHNLDCCATNPSEMEQIFSAWQPSAESRMVERYQTIVDTYHTKPGLLRAIGLSENESKRC